MGDNESDTGLPEEATGKQGNQIGRDHKSREDESLNEVVDTEQQERQDLADPADYVGGDFVLQDKVEKDRIVADRYIEQQQEINETEYAEADGSDTPPLIFHEKSESDAPIIDYSDVLSQLLVNDETGMAHSPDGVPIPAAYVHGDVVFGDKILGNKIISAVYIERQTVINRTLVDNIEGRPPDRGEPPYKGLQSYTENDADLFFGREQLTAELIQRLIETNFLAVIGASGSGKSSVVRAGVVPALAGQKHSNIVPEALAAEWTPYIFSPSQQPLRSLAAALFPDQDQQSELFSSQLLEDDTTLLNRLRTLSSSAPILLVIDQFEELFTLDESQDASPKEVVAAFIGNLVTAVTTDKQVNLKIVITLRSDFYTDCLEFEALHELLERHQKIISHMNKDEMREAIIQPAAKERWKIQDGLVEEFLEDVSEEPGRLPLLSHALLETWKRRRMRVMTLTGYQEAGGVRKAIAQTAGTTYNKFSSSQQTRVKQIFKRLTALSETHDMYTRRRVSREELGQDEETQTVINELSYARLVTADDYMVEVAHEAVIREWEALRSWLDEDREGLIIHRRLTISAQTWKEKDKDSSFLYQGLRLDEAQAWTISDFDELNELEKEFFDESIALRRKQHRQRIIAISTFLILLIGGLLSLLLIQNNANRNISNALATTESESIARATSESIAVTQQAEAEQAGTSEALARTEAEAAATEEAIARADAERESLISKSQALAAFAPLAPGHPYDTQLGELLSVQAYRFNQEANSDNDWLIDRNLRPLLNNENWVFSGYLWAHEGEIRDVAFSSDGTKLASTGDDGTVRMWDLTVPSPTFIIIYEQEAPLFSLEFSQSGEYLVAGGQDNSVHLWIVKDGDFEYVDLPEHDGSINSLSFSNDEDVLASASDDGTVRLWDLSDNNKITYSRLPISTSNIPITSVSFSPVDKGTLITANRDGEKYIWDLQNLNDSPEKISTSFFPNTNVVQFAPDGRRIFLLDTQAGGAVDYARQLPGPLLSNRIYGVPIPNKITSGGFSPTGTRMLAYGTSSGIVRINLIDEEFDLPYGHEGKHGGNINNLSFSQEGRKLATAGSDGKIGIWEVKSRPDTVFDALPGQISQSDLVENVYVYVTGQVAFGNLRVNLLDLTNELTPPMILTDMSEEIVHLKLSDNGKYLVTVTKDTEDVYSTRLWDIENDNNVYPLITNNSEIEVIEFSANSNLLAIGFHTTIRLWDLSEPQFLQNPVDFLGFDEETNDLIFSASGTYLASSGTNTDYMVGDNVREGKLARIWDLTSVDGISAPIFETEFESFFPRLAFSPDENFLFVSSIDPEGNNGGVEIFDLRNMGNFTTSFMELSIVDTPGLMIVSPDGKWVAARTTGIVGGSNRDIHLWNINNIEESYVLVGHQGAVKQVVFSADSRYVISSSADNTIRVWDINKPNADPIILSGHENSVEKLALRQDGQILVSVDANNVVRLWTWQLDDLILHACEIASRNMTMSEWEFYVGDTISYTMGTCPNLPFAPDVAAEITSYVTPGAVVAPDQIIPENNE